MNARGSACAIAAAAGNAERRWQWVDGDGEAAGHGAVTGRAAHCHYGIGTCSGLCGEADTTACACHGGNHRAAEHELVSNTGHRAAEVEHAARAAGAVAAHARYYEGRR